LCKVAVIMGAVNAVNRLFYEISHKKSPIS
jgi:hypothetical protein